ncbi:MAG: DUF521 domain-containing protein [Spirochaetes bacterium]|nr:DUF521 domain-containing protein [Spirochaetota bacterium]
MRLTKTEREMLTGAKGDTIRKAMETVVRYGDTFGAKRLVPIDHNLHMVTSMGIPLLTTVFELMDELIAGGIRLERPFTVDPRPVDYSTVNVGPLKKIAFRIMYGRQTAYEEQLKKIGLKDSNAFTCACYLDEVGNIPKKGDILAWSESSAVVYANSVLGARTNRNSGVIDLLCGVVGRAPEFGFLTDEGRMADWIVEVRTSKTPEAQVLGSAIGMKVMEDVPYITGLDKHLGTRLTQDAKDYLKDMGAALASNGAVGLYHVDKLTPEARERKKALLKKKFRTYVVDDAEMERVYRSYPVMWKKPDARPKLCFIGCPHLSLAQARAWLSAIEGSLSRHGQRSVAVRTVLTTAPDVAAAFLRESGVPDRLSRAGVTLSSICPLMYMNNPLCGREPVVTNSNKLRTYTTARYFRDEDVLDIIATGRVK